MIIEEKKAKYLEQWIRIWEDFHNPVLVLTDKDEISVKELEEQENCPNRVKKCLTKLKRIKKVFFKQEGNRWAFSLYTDYQIYHGLIAK